MNKINAARKQRARQELRLRILDAARELFLIGGTEGVTLRKIAERIEYSATTIYQHFSSKELLIQEVCAVDFESFSRNLKQAERLPDPMERLRKVSLGYADFGWRHPRQYRAMFMPPLKDAPSSLSGNDSVLTPPDPVRAGAYDFLYSAVFKAMAAGCFRSEYRDVPLMAQVVWAGLHGVISLHLERAQFPGVPWRAPQPTLEMMIDLLLHGLTGQAPVEM